MFLVIGVDKAVTEGWQKAYEMMIIGSILFIPGSYHTFVAAMAWKRVAGYSYDDVAVFDENFNKDE